MQENMIRDAPVDGKHGEIAESAKESKRQKRFVQFSKILTAFVAITMLPASYYVIYRCLELAELAISEGYMGALPYLTAVVGFVQATVVLVLGFYYNNSKAEKVAKAQYGNTAAPCGDPLKRDF